MDRMMRDFIRLVSEMRAAQKEYFRSRDKTVLQNSKLLEKSVDAKLEQFKQGCCQQTLFMEKYELTITIFDEQHLNDVLQKLSEIDVELWKISRRTKGNSVFELKNALTNIENAIDNITNVLREARKLHEQAEN